MLESDGPGFVRRQGFHRLFVDGLDTRVLIVIQCGVVRAGGNRTQILNRDSPPHGLALINLSGVRCHTLHHQVGHEGLGANLVDSDQRRQHEADETDQAACPTRQEEQMSQNLVWVKLFAGHYFNF